MEESWDRSIIWSRKSLGLRSALLLVVICSGAAVDVVADKPTGLEFEPLEGDDGLN